MTIKIYGIVCPIAGEIRYIGKTEQSLNRRLSAHICESRKNKLSHKHRWIANCLANGLRPTMWLLEEVMNPNDWPDREIAWIKKANQIGISLTNQTSGGDGIVLTDPDAIARFKTNLAKAMKRVRCADGYLESRSKVSMNVWSNHRAAILESFNSVETKSKQSMLKKTAWANPEIRLRMMNRWTPEARAKQATEIIGRKEKIKAAMTPEVRAKQAEKLKETWARRKAEMQSAKEP